MNRLMVGIAIGLVAGAVGTATASSVRDYYLKPGDRAITTATYCDVIRWGKGASPGFRCTAGFDYQATYGVIINELYIALLRYTSKNHYRVIWRGSMPPR